MTNLPDDISCFLSRKRSRKNERKNEKAQKRRLYNEENNAQKLTKFGRRSSVIELLAGSARLPLQIKRDKVTVTVPGVFSVISAPESVIKLVTGFARCLYNNPKKVKRCYFDHSKMQDYDLAANALLDIVAVEFNTERKFRKSRKRLNVGGRYSKDPATMRFIRALGIIKHLAIKHEAPKPKEARALCIYDARNKSYEKASANSDRKSRVTEKFVVHVEKCLKTISRNLTDSGRAQLSGYLGEILTNAEDHAGLMDWSILGYLDTSLPVPVCEIAIFNFGRSIAESLSKDSSDYTQQHIGRYIQDHQSKSLFGTKWNECDLLTVIALQGHVSRLNRSSAETRGQGTVDLIHFFQNVHVECGGSEGGKEAKMAILSGSTHILFDGTYEMRPNEHGVPVIAFNDANDLSKAPDPKYVTSLGDLRFPGTIISIRFPLSESSGSLVEEADHG